MTRGLLLILSQLNYVVVCHRKPCLNDLSHEEVLLDDMLVDHRVPNIQCLSQAFPQFSKALHIHTLQKRLTMKQFLLNGNDRTNTRHQHLSHSKS